MRYSTPLTWQILRLRFFLCCFFSSFSPIFLCNSSYFFLVYKTCCNNDCRHCKKISNCHTSTSFIKYLIFKYFYISAIAISCKKYIIFTKKIIESGKKSTKKESILTTNSRCSPLMIFNYVQRTIPPISLLTLS